MIREKDKAKLEELLKFANRASVLTKTPQCNEIFRIMMDKCAEYNNQIVNKKPQDYETYLFTLGKLQGLREFMELLKNASNNKDEYARKLKELQ